jgi:hypothetical protein
MSDRIRRLIHEIHRRSLWQVLGVYVLAWWAVLQVVDTLAGALNLPTWFPSFALVLITAQLVDADADTHLWSDTFGREPEDVFAIQREIATAVADELQVTLSGEQPETGITW